MYATYEIKSSSGNYTIQIGEDLIHGVLNIYSDSIIVIDRKLCDRLPAHAVNIIIIDATEENKSLEKMAEYVAQLRELGANRDTHLVAIGGGIIQDISTFICSIYMRGISWTYMPTTVLSMADSCIGGKSSINVAGYKNLVGNFYPPKDVFVDVDFSRTLSEDMIVGGFFEAAKICYAKSHESFIKFIEMKPSVDSNAMQMQSIVSVALSTKKWFIEVDEFDQNERLLLNFGHTFGHAIEASTNFEVHHGVGVGVGMLVACQYARQNIPMQGVGVQIIGELEKYILSSLRDKTGRSIGMPKIIDLEATLAKFEHDKKHKKNYYRIITPRDDCQLEIIELEKTIQTRTHINDAYKDAFQLIGWNYH